MVQVSMVVPRNNHRGRTQERACLTTFPTSLPAHTLETATLAWLPRARTVQQRAGRSRRRRRLLVRARARWLEGGRKECLALAGRTGFFNQEGTRAHIVLATAVERVVPNNSRAPPAGLSLRCAAHPRRRWRAPRHTAKLRAPPHASGVA
jgi:hypothetical protein